MKGILTAIFILIFSITLKCQDLAIKLSFDKEKYLKSEPVECMLEITNDNTQPVSMETFTLDCGSENLEIDLTDEHGNKLPCSSSRFSYFAIGKSYLTLQPGESKYFLLSISFCFGPDFRNSISLSVHPSFNTGEYNLRVKYRTTTENDSTIKEYISDNNKFTVAEPENNEDKTVIENFIKLCRPGYRGIGDKSKFAQDLIKIADSYPSSSYAPVILRELMNVIEISKDKTLDKFVLKQIEKYPDSFITLGILNKYLYSREEFLITNNIDAKLSKNMKKYKDYYKKRNDRKKEIR